MKQKIVDENVDTEDSRMTKFLKRVQVNPNLVMLKISLFVMYGATASLLPYLTIHMQSIGLTVEEISIVYMVLPFTTFLSPPITGYLVDKFGQYKPVVILSLVLNAVFHHSLLLIPHMETPGKIPSAYVIRHPTMSSVEVWWSPCPSRLCPEEKEFDIILAGCVDYCMPQDKDDSFSEENSDINLPSDTNEIVEANMNVDKNQQEHNEKKLHILLEPGTGMLNSPKHVRIQNKVITPFKPDIIEYSAFFLLSMHKDLREPVEHLGMEVMADDGNNTVIYLKKRFGENTLLEARVNLTLLEKEDLRCGGQLFATNLTHNMIKELAADCMVQQCTFRDGGPETCPPDYQESDDKIFWIYFFLRFCGTIMLSGGVMMLDPIALTMIQKYGGEFGRERLFSTLGMAIFSPLTGLLIDHASRHSGYTDYSAAFYMYDVLLAISALTVMLMPLGVRLPAENIFTDLLRIIKLPHVILFIVFLFFLGNFWGFIESFLFLYLKELGASNYLLGATITAGTISSVPFLYGAGKITRKYGHVNIIIVAFFSHAARLIGYSFIENAWWCFPFEVIEAVAVHLMWIAAATYCALLAPKNLLATLIGVLGMAHFSLGRGSGSFFGGLLIGTVGTRESFRIMGMLAIVGGITYGLLHYFWLRKVEAGNNSKEEQQEYSEGEHLNSEASESFINIKHKDSVISSEHQNLFNEVNNCCSKAFLEHKKIIPRSRSSSLEMHSHHDHQCRVDLLKSALHKDHIFSNNGQTKRPFTLSEDTVTNNHKIIYKSVPFLPVTNEAQHENK